EIEHGGPGLGAVQHHVDFLRQLVGLRQRENLEQLVAGSKSAGKNHECFGKVRKPELAHEEVVELEVQTFGDVGVRALFERQANVHADGLAARLARASV